MLHGFQFLPGVLHKTMLRLNRFHQVIAETERQFIFFFVEKYEIV